MERFDNIPFMGEIMMISFNYAPKNWAFCNGQLIPINQNQPLFALLGTTYGGNGTTNFGLPDLRGKVPIHMGNGFTLGQTGGEVGHALNSNEIPPHSHQLSATNLAAKVGGTPDTANPVGNYFANQAGLTTRFSKRPDSLAIANTVVSGSTGISQLHNNIMPSLTINFVIALVGIFPSRN
ncbi:phage tail protein [Pedobacter nototheniae]|uniref:phage tail protein n=1 Tax=Pedobacter nototheniae TaxID=2488994 RepID=UPI00292ED59F|nr:tail fiber protein [Pedobacter nototheniae]